MIPELTGNVAVSFDASALHQLCTELIPSFDKDRFEIVAVRVYAGAETFITFFLADRENQSTTLPPGKYPVKKHKVQLESLEPLHRAIAGFNLTVTNPAYMLDDMEVMNR